MFAHEIHSQRRNGVVVRDAYADDQRREKQAKYAVTADLRHRERRCA